MIESIHGQARLRTGSLSTQEYRYDAAARLTRVDDRPAGSGCTMRRYAFDADSNRKSLTTTPPDTAGNCTTSGTAQVKTHSHDSADRLTDTGVEYDAFGRITRLAGSLAGGDELETEFYVTDRVRRLKQGGRTVTIQLDPLGRPWERSETNRTGVERMGYGDLSDSPVWSLAGNGIRTRYVEGLQGDLAVIHRATDGGTDREVTLQMSNLHGDTVGEATYAAGVTTPSATWETDEFGVPRKPVRPPIAQVGTPKTATAPLSTSLIVERPTGVEAGDLLVAGLTFKFSHGWETNLPAGWNIARWAENQGSGYAVVYKVATASEPSFYTFSFATGGPLTAGLVALRGANTQNPINTSAAATGPAWNTTPDARVPGVAPTVDDVAIVSMVGSATGDTNAGDTWEWPSGQTDLWDLSTGVTTLDKNQSVALEVRVNGKDTGNTPTIIPTDHTGTSNTPWAALAVAITPKRDTSQFRYRYVGKHRRTTALPSGVIEMGVRGYVPQLGRFLQVDPIRGGSANAYDYCNADPVNCTDLSGECPVCVPVGIGAGRIAIAVLGMGAATVYVMTRAELRELSDRIFNPVFNWDPFSWSHGKQSGSDPGLNAAEREAMRLRSEGKKFDKKAWRSALRKIKTAAKFGGKKRNRQSKDR